MSDLRSPILVAENLSYTIDSTQTLFEDVHLSLQNEDRVALIGTNGVGKSTLLKILAGQVQPSAGSVTCRGLTYYLPQVSTMQANLPSGSVLDFLYTQSHEWWEIVQILEASFRTELDLSLPISDLSGGERVKLLLAVGLSRSPDVLLLDEPTNHLDYLALEDLRKMLNSFSGACIIVSHKPFFLDQVAQTVWELSPAGVQIYGGNFSDYKLQKQRETAAKARSHETARKELKRAKASALKEQQRAARSNREGRRQALSSGLPRVVAGARKRRAENTAAKLKVKHDQAIANATQQVTDTKVRTQRTTGLQLTVNTHKHRTLVEISDTHLWVADRLLVKDLQLCIASGDRISLIGPNGSGKSCLVKALLRMDTTPAVLKSGNVKLANMRTVYLDQSYTFVDRPRTVLENLQQANPELNYQLLRQQLGHVLFFGDDVHKPASVLSGGELARLAIAIITISKLDLLILDEPTNNLDIVTVDQMVATLNNYQGALWVISHDLDFLSRLQITRSFLLKDQRLRQTAVLPEERTRFHGLLQTE